MYVHMYIHRYNENIQNAGSITININVRVISVSDSNRKEIVHITYLNELVINIVY